MNYVTGISPSGVGELNYMIVSIGLILLFIVLCVWWKLNFFKLQGERR